MLDIEPKADIFFFYLFGIDGLKNFIIQDDRKVIEKILFGTKQNIQLQFSATIFFHFVQASGNKLKLCDFVNIWMVEDRVQDLNSMTWGIFKIYFFENLFNLNENSKIQNKKRLNKRTIETLLNELFVLDDQATNEARIQQYANENNILL